jgi:DNA-binding winged helix-turn-helix (wHTH) protein
MIASRTTSWSPLGCEDVTVRFGLWTFDGPRRLLIDGEGQPVHLPPKAFDLLALLIANAPRVVPKTELHARLWPETFVAEATLVALVKDVRRALQDHNSAAPILRTSHGVGYAFCGALELERPEAAVMNRWVIVRGRRVPLKAGDNLIGRDPRAEIWLDAAGVSRQHARIAVTASASEIEDLGSKNGTFVGEVRVVDPVTLRNGDIIRIGPLAIVYRMDVAGMTTETVPMSVEPVP